MNKLLQYCKYPNLNDIFPSYSNYYNCITCLLAWCADVPPRPNEKLKLSIWLFMQLTMTTQTNLLHAWAANVIFYYNHYLFHILLLQFSQFEIAIACPLFTHEMPNSRMKCITNRDILCSESLYLLMVYLNEWRVATNYEIISSWSITGVEWYG